MISTIDTLTPAPKDGIDGISVIFSSEVCTVSCDSVGNLLDGEIDKATTKIRVYKGDKLLNFSEYSINYIGVQDNDDYDAGPVEFANDFYYEFRFLSIKESGTYVDITITVESIILKKRFTVTKVIAGSKGPLGRMSYPVGEWNVNTKYICTAYICPVTLYSGIYYALQKEVELTGGLNPATDYASNGSNSNWIPFDMFKYIFSEVLFADFGKLASAIFSGDNMFSQYGVDQNGNAITSSDGYKNFNSTTNPFIPNILLDFKIGSGWLAKKNISWDDAGNVSIIGNIIGKLSTASINKQRIVLDPDNSRLSFFSATNTELAYLGFYNNNTSILVLNDTAGNKAWIYPSQIALQKAGSPIGLTEQVYNDYLSINWMGLLSGSSSDTLFVNNLSVGQIFRDTNNVTNKCYQLRIKGT